jgi:uncharacterized protein YodC (DUF2158 family)
VKYFLTAKISTLMFATLLFASKLLIEINYQKGIIMKAFNLGDLVTLKSGSPVMTVEGLNKDKKILCVWFNKRDEKCSSSFFAETLKNHSEEQSLVEETVELPSSEEISTEDAPTPEQILSPEHTSMEEIEKPKKNRKSKKDNDEQPSND